MDPGALLCKARKPWDALNQDRIRDSSTAQLPRLQTRMEPQSCDIEFDSRRCRSISPITLLKCHSASGLKRQERSGIVHCSSVPFQLLQLRRPEDGIVESALQDLLARVLHSLASRENNTAAASPLFSSIAFAFSCTSLCLDVSIATP